MSRYRVSKSAERDLGSIFVYWAERAGVPVADRLIDAIVERFRMLGEYPAAGVACADLAVGIRCFPAGKHLIYYRRSRRGIEILHVFDGRRDQKKARAGS